MRRAAMRLSRLFFCTRSLQWNTPLLPFFGKSVSQIREQTNAFSGVAPWLQVSRRKCTGLRSPARRAARATRCAPRVGAGAVSSQCFPSVVNTGVGKNVVQ